MDRLPPELLERILLQLHPLDRLNSALTCRSWANAVHSSALLGDIWLVITCSNAYTVARGVIGSHRQYTNLRILGARLSDFSEDFWMKLGRKLRRLELLDCTLKPESLYLIVQHCPGLESVTLKARNAGKLDPPEGWYLSRARKLLLNVQHLRLEIPLRAEALNNLFGLMPNATSLNLKLKGYALHTPFLIPCMRATQNMFTKLAFYLDLSGDQVIELVSAYSASLQELRLGCEMLTRQAFEAIVTCPGLRRLCLKGAFGFGDDHLKALIRNASDLKCLTLSSCFSLTDASVVHLVDLGKLRHLALEDCFQVTGEALGDLGDITTLRSLQLKRSRFDIRSIRGVASMKDLRILFLGCQMDVDGFNVICENMEKLEMLELGNCERLSDSEGVKFARLKHLRSLKFYRGVGFTDLTFEKGIGSPDMETLDLDGCHLTDVGLGSIVAHHSRLRTLRLFECEKITDSGLGKLFRGEPFLNSLSLVEGRHLTQWCLEELENSCPRLQFVYLYLDSRGKRAAEQLCRDRPDIKVRYTLVIY